MRWKREGLEYDGIEIVKSVRLWDICLDKEYMAAT